MPFQPLKLGPGIVRGASPYDTPGFWWDMNQVRWRAGNLMPIGGWNRTTSAPLDGGVRAINVWRNNANGRMVVVGTDSKLYVDQGSYVDITPAGWFGLSHVGVNGGYGTFGHGMSTYGTPRAAPSPAFAPYAYYSFGQWGEDLILTANSDGRLYYYTQSTPTTAPVLIGTAPTGCNAVIVTNERHAMVFGTSSDGREIAWSSREAYADWNFASTTNTAGFLKLTSKTPLMKGFKVREGILAFSTTDVFLIRYVGEPYIYAGTDPISDTQMFNPTCVATFNGEAAWIARSGIQHYANGVVQNVPCPVIDAVFKDMDALYGPFRIHGAHNGLFPEVTWFYPSAGSTECNRYLTWNYAENWFSWGSMTRSAMAPAEAFKFPYMGAPDGHMYQHEDGWLAAGQSRVGDVWAETGALALGNGDRTIDVNQLLISTGNGFDTVSVSAYGRYAPEGTEYTDGPFYPRSDGYTDARFSYRDARLRFAMTRDGAFSLGPIKIDATPGTGR